MDINRWGAAVDDKNMVADIDSLQDGCTGEFPGFSRGRQLRNDSLAGYLDQIERALSGPLAPVLIGRAVLFAILQLAAPRMRWISLTFVLDPCMLQRLPDKWYDLTLAFPLEALSNYSRVLTLLILVSLAVPAMFMQSGWQ